MILLFVILGSLAVESEHKKINNGQNLLMGKFLFHLLQ